MRLARALVAAVKEVFPRYPFAFLYRYRVLSMVGGRCQLQAVLSTAGLPNMVHVSVLPGVAGLEATLKPGAVVLVAFIEGDPAQPVVTHFEAAGGDGWKPISLVIDAETTIRLGGDAAMRGVARIGDQAGPYTIVSASTKVLAV